MMTKVEVVVVDDDDDADDDDDDNYVLSFVFEALYDRLSGKLNVYIFLKGQPGSACVYKVQRSHGSFIQSSFYHSRN